jgi:transposase
VREFRTFTAELQRLADWLAQCGVKTVALESTGVYWIPLYEILEQRGFEVLLVNARDLHNVRGRKRDVKDCEWLRELHSVGRLRASFRPRRDPHSAQAESADRDEVYKLRLLLTVDGGPRCPV